MYLNGPVLFPVFLLIENPINRLRFRQFLGTKTTEVNKSLKTDANEAYYVIGFLIIRKTGHKLLTSKSPNINHTARALLKKNSSFK